MILIQITMMTMIPVSNNLYNIGRDINDAVYQETDATEYFDYIWDTMYANIMDDIPNTISIDYFRFH